MHDNIAQLKRKLKRGPKLSRKDLAAYLSNVSLGRFAHHPDHRDRPGEPRCLPTVVPKLMVELLELLPPAAVSEACGKLGHPSFWLGPGYRYTCICGDCAYKD